MSISWTIDGSPVRMDEWSCDSIANGGYNQFRATAASSRLQASQGSIVTGYRTDGSVLWQGAISAEPKTHRGIAALLAEGLKVRAEKLSGPLLYRDDDISRLVSADSDPHNYNSNPDFTWSVNPGRAICLIAKDSTYAVGNQASIVGWYEGCEVSQLTYTWNNPSATIANHIIRIQSATGPSGGLTNEGFTSLSSPGPATVTKSITDGQDLIRIGLETLNAITVGENKRVTITGYQAYGRTTAATFTAAEVAADVGQLAGFDTAGVTASGDDILPLYWTDGTYADLLTYVADLMDWRWLVTADAGLGVSGVASGPALSFGPWDRTWTAALQRGVAELDLEPLAVYNQARVNFSSVSGVKRSASVTASPDPLALAGWNNVYDYDLADPQASNTLALALADRLIDYYSQPRVRGRLTLHECRDSSGYIHSGYDVGAGELIDITDLDPAAGPQRIVGASYDQHGTHLELSEDFAIGRYLFRAGKGRRHRR